MRANVPRLPRLFGTNFMALFAETVSVLRKCLRKGVLWFIRDPTDPDVSLFSPYGRKI